MTFIFFQGDRHPFVMETVKADDNAKMGMYGVSIVFCLKSFASQSWTLDLHFQSLSTEQTADFTGVKQ